MAQLTELLLPVLEDPVSNPGIGSYYGTTFVSKLYKKMKLKKKGINSRYHRIVLPPRVKLKKRPRMIPYFKGTSI